MTTPLVWLPTDFEDLDGIPEGLRVEFVSPEKVPDTIEEVRFFVPGYGWGSGLADLLARMSSLEVVQVLSAGVDDIRRQLPAGVTLCNGRDIHTTATAELALTLTLASLRLIPTFTRAQDRGEWRDVWSESLADKRVMILGYGSIGRAIGARILPNEAEVVPVARVARDGVHGLAELPDLLPDVDVVIVVTPLTAETRGLVDAAFLARMQEGALLVNVARGAVVDTDALTAACAAGRIRAGLDVTDPEPLPADHPLWTTPGVLLTPHVGGHTSAYESRARALLRRQLERFAAGAPLANVITGEY